MAKRHGTELELNEPLGERIKMTKEKPTLEECENACRLLLEHKGKDGNISWSELLNSEALFFSENVNKEQTKNKLDSLRKVQDNYDFVLPLLETRKLELVRQKNGWNYKALYKNHPEINRRKFERDRQLLNFCCQFPFVFQLLAALNQTRRRQVVSILSKNPNTQTAMLNTGLTTDFPPPTTVRELLVLPVLANFKPK